MWYTKLCPKCNKPAREEEQFCTDDGEIPLPFNPRCICGKEINSYYSYIFTDTYAISRHFPFLYTRQTPESSGNNCDNCGINIKKQYKVYLIQWRKDNPYKFVKKHTLPVNERGELK